MSRCEAFWVRCERRAHKVAVFENVFKEEQRLRLCDEHATQFSELDFRKQLIDRALDTLGALQASGMKRSVTEMHQHPAQLALIEHQATCERCAAVRDWITVQTQHGRVVDQSDVDRIGHYVIEHSCEEGVELNYQVGLAMRGER